MKKERNDFVHPSRSLSVDSTHPACRRSETIILTHRQETTSNVEVKCQSWLCITSNDKHMINMCSSQLLTASMQMGIVYGCCC